MKKIFLVFIISFAFTAGVVAGEEVASYSSEVEATSVYELMKTYQENQNTDTSGLAAKFAFLASVRLNLHVGDEIVGVVMEGGKISEVVEGGLDDPTMELKTQENISTQLQPQSSP